MPAQTSNANKANLETINKLRTKNELLEDKLSSKDESIENFKKLLEKSKEALETIN